MAGFLPIELLPTESEPIQDEIVDTAQVEQMKLPEAPTSNVEPEIEGADSEAPPSSRLIEQCVREKA